LHHALPKADPRIGRLAGALREAGFSGDIETGFGARLVLATDNSIYQRPPQAAIFPRAVEDIALAVQVLRDSFPNLSLTARGGGTGTNGQSLSHGVILDCSRYLDAISDFSAEAGTVVVEPGVVLDQLNAFLAPHGYFFPPHVSTASRATIGGMVATDASGKGSRHYGKTSDYILGMDVVLANGEMHHIAPLNAGQLQAALARDDGLSTLLRQVGAQLEAAAPEAAKIFPRMNRGLTGYNLRDALPETGGINLCKLLAGSEGTLALTQRMTLRVIRKPRHSALVVLFYDNFLKALGHVPTLIEADPLAVEILDDKVLNVARRDAVWAQLSGLFGQLGPETKAVNFVEFVGDTPEAVSQQMARLTAQLDAAPPVAFLVRDVTAPEAVRAAWSLRSKAMGLMGDAETDKSAIAFVEDAAVPPEELVAFTSAFCALLDSHHLSYGMYGHADVGCLHVRPVVDMRQPEMRALIRPISDGVAALAKAHGGLLWGEHGRGLRGEYSPFFFGSALYEVLRQVKTVFDPDDRFNPGKLARPSGSDAPITRIDAVTMRGSLDAQIAPEPSRQFAKAIDCNGNGACHAWSVAETMCPSYKATRDKTQSPKGRASLIREWARTGSAEAEDALVTSLDTCLSCRACASQCPVRVDIPTMKSKVLQQHFSRHARPFRDRLLRWVEPMLLAMRRLPALANFGLANPLSRAVAKRVFKLVDLPLFNAQSLEAQLRAASIPLATPRALASLSASDRTRAVILWPDSFLASFDAAPIRAAARLLSGMGFLPLVAPVKANGKVLEVRGYLGAYHPIRDRLQASLKALAASGLPIIAIEPATLIQARSDGGDLIALDQFLARHLDRIVPLSMGQKTVDMLLHCTEKTADPQTAARWQVIFERFGQKLRPVDVGCCGMSGLFGHEAEHADLSRRIYGLGWEGAIAEADGFVVATGFSCRCQAKRFSNIRPSHPAELLAALLAP